MEMCVESVEVKMPALLVEVALEAFAFGGEDERENLGGEELMKAPGACGEDDSDPTNGIENVVGLG